MSADRDRNISVQGGLAALFFGVLVYVAIYLGVQTASDPLEVLFAPESLKGKAVFHVAVSVIMAWTSLAGIWIVLRFFGRSFKDIGWGEQASIWGWATAAAIAALYAGMLMAGPLADAPFFTDWSFFRVATALSVAVSAGVCEETIFRGFVMTEAKRAGMPAFVQVMLSAALFGLAHVGWSLVSGEFELAAFLGAAISTGVLGALFAVAYLLSRRSLTPVIVAHAAIDLIIEPWLILHALSGGFAQ